MARPDFSRYIDFIAANPSWPSIATLRRRAEGVLWEERADPQTVIGFFRFGAAAHRQGTFRAGARAAWRKATVPAPQRRCARLGARTASPRISKRKARAAFAGLITPADDAARMDARLYVEDDDAGLRAAQHLERGRARHRQGARRRHQQVRQGQGAARSGAGRRAATIPATCSAASNGCAAPTRSPRRRNGCWRRRTIRNGSAISINGGSSGG